MQCLLDTVDSPKTVVRTSQFTIQTVSLQFTEKTLQLAAQCSLSLALSKLDSDASSIGQ